VTTQTQNAQDSITHRVAQLGGIGGDAPAFKFGDINNLVASCNSCVIWAAPGSPAWRRWRWRPPRW